MTPEEVNRTIEFLLEHSARFAVDMEQMKERTNEWKKEQQEINQRHDRLIEELKRGLDHFRESTQRFQSMTAEIVSIQSRRLDQNDELLRRIADKFL